MPAFVHGLGNPGRDRPTLSNLRGCLPGARWIDPENYHVNLQVFINMKPDIDGREKMTTANEIALILFRQSQALRGCLQVCRALADRKPARPWWRPRPSPALDRLQASSSAESCASSSTREGRKFTPHLTLARLRDASNRMSRIICRARLLPTRCIHGVSRFGCFSVTASTAAAVRDGKFLRAERVI